MISFISFIHIVPSTGLFSSILSDVIILEDDVGAMTLVFLQFLQDWVYITFTVDIVE